MLFVVGVMNVMVFVVVVEVLVGVLFWLYGCDLVGGFDCIGLIVVVFVVCGWVLVLFNGYYLL